MEKIKILVSYHKPWKVYHDDVYTPIHVGRQITPLTDEMPTMLGDDSGDHISWKNTTYHVRRGDYLSKDNKGLYWNLSETDYYQQATAYIRDRFVNCSFFVFSNDMPWVKSNLKIEDAYFVDWNNGKDSAYDMYLMSQAKIVVMANSTFSFWAAYLNKRAALCIYPSKWYHEESGLTNPDIFPEEWIRI